jgi:hypothetical protein
VNTEPDSHRLQRLQQILADSQSASRASEERRDPAELHLANVPLERIREVTRELEKRAGEVPDAMDVLTMRVLLNDYTSAVAQLRAVARLVEPRVDAAASPIQEARRFVRLYDKHRASDGRS